MNGGVLPTVANPRAGARRGQERTKFCFVDVEFEKPVSLQGRM